MKLTSIEKQELEKSVKRHTVGQQIALRARIVLATVEGKSNCQIARELQVSRDIVWLLRQRCLQLQAIPYDGVEG